MPFYQAQGFKRKEVQCVAYFDTARSSRRTASLHSRDRSRSVSSNGSAGSSVASLYEDAADTDTDTDGEAQAQLGRDYIEVGAPAPTPSYRHLAVKLQQSARSSLC